MSRKRIEIHFLRALLSLSISLVPFVLSNPPRKKWLFIYVYNAISNMAIDTVLTRRGTLSYPIRLFPKIFKIHILFDVLLYPLTTMIYLQATQKDKLIQLIRKLLYFAIPLTVFETWAQRNTNLIKWGNGWRGYHTFIGVSLKSLFARVVVVRFYNRIFKM